MARYDFQIGPADYLVACPQTIPEDGGTYVIVLADGEGVVNDRLREMGQDQPPFALWPLLYVGATQFNLRRRIQQHFGLDSRQSTMRQNAGLLLDHDLGLGVQRIPTKRYFCFEREDLLTDWLLANTMIGFCPSDEPFEAEREILANQPGLFNIGGRGPTSVRSRLSVLRSAASGLRSKSRRSKMGRTGGPSN